MAQNPFFYGQQPPFMQPQVIQSPQFQMQMQQQKQLQQQLQMQQQQKQQIQQQKQQQLIQLQIQQIQKNKQKYQQQPNPSILGVPPRPAIINPTINPSIKISPSIANNKLIVPPVPSPFINPVLNNFKKSAPSLAFTNSDILARLAKLTPQLNDPEKVNFNAKLLRELIDRGLSKQTAPNFYSALEVLAKNIPKEEFNKAPMMMKVFELAYLRKYAFSSNTVHLENITQWKRELESITNLSLSSSLPSSSLSPKKESTTDGRAPKRPRTSASSLLSSQYKSHNVIDVGHQVEVLQEEVLELREEIRFMREKHKREIELLYQHLQLSLPAPPTIPESELDSGTEGEQEPEPDEPESATSSLDATSPPSDATSLVEPEPKPEEVDLNAQSTNTNGNSTSSSSVKMSDD